MSITNEVNRGIINAWGVRDTDAYLAAIEFELDNMLQKVIVERERNAARRMKS